ncbi:MAG: TlyA family RNA methyltransferase [Acidobacteriota bacterium]|nr:TlyA family RNA methyltransferase [Acidobacteriota bacterium]
MRDRRRERERLDVLVVNRGLAETRTRARALIMAGRVTADGERLDKPGLRIPTDTPLAVEPGPRYVSRGAFKLVSALDVFGVVVQGRAALDVGASTGGFTEVLLEHGAQTVIALDVGRGQLDWSLRNDTRVRVLDGVNARYLEPGDLPLAPQLIVMDVSFISVTRILPALRGCLDPGGELVTLVKPQFEVGRGKVGRGGIVRDTEAHREVLDSVAAFAREDGWRVRGVARSAIRGAEGNAEFFLYLDLARGGLEGDDLARAIDESLRCPEHENGE